ncbi:MAG: hypothetical protein WAU69_16190 [Solirubrobacteraceae bacterium]
MPVGASLTSERWGLRPNSGQSSSCAETPALAAVGIGICALCGVDCALGGPAAGGEQPAGGQPGSQQREGVAAEEAGSPVHDPIILARGGA